MRFLLLLALLSGCGPDERAERDKVLSAVERMRAMPRSAFAQQRKEAEELLALHTRPPVRVYARDACGALFRPGDEYGALEAELTAEPMR